MLIYVNINIIFVEINLIILVFIEFIHNMIVI